MICCGSDRKRSRYDGDDECHPQALPKTVFSPVRFCTYFVLDLCESNYPLCFQFDRRDA
jgi:hypothetical protein